MSKCNEHDVMCAFVATTYRMAWKVWKEHNGNPSEAALEQLEIHGDWPRGMAARVMQRIKGDSQLRAELERWS